MMRRKYIYMILAALGILFSCQRVELPDEQQTKPEGIVSGEATISFSAMLPAVDPDTKAMGDDPFSGTSRDIKNMYLVIFDANGMLVETREATIDFNTELDHTVVDNDGNTVLDKQGETIILEERPFTVTLTVTDQPRIIHFIANCPVDQIVYGHETSVIGNMYVEKDQDAGTPETAYWARITVDNLVVEGVDTQDPHFASQEVANAFKCVPMLRNFAQVTVIEPSEGGITVPQGDTFEYIGFTLYNTVDMGTVAPYNNKSGSFQSFINPDTGKKYKYPDLMELTYPYEGHALSAAELNQTLETDSTSDDKYKWYGTGVQGAPGSFYMYERKISVKTDVESDWNESPPHLIIKGKYNNEVCYYKVDLVYAIKETVTEDGKEVEKVKELKYYNILRNFKYQFTITAVESKGYDSVEDAVKGATSNNLAGSSTTSKFTSISDNIGRLSVSYTDRTLVTGDDITLYYKYEPTLGGAINNDLVEDGGFVSLENVGGGLIQDGEVIRQYTVADIDEKSGEWKDYRRIDIKVNNPHSMAKEQTIAIKTDKATLARQIHYTLRQKYVMEVVCTPQVESKIGEEVQVDIKLPGGLTENLFPLQLAIEVYDMSLSPYASKNTLPVETGPSTIPTDEKQGKPSFYYVKTIETKDEYDKLPTEGTQKVVKTYWLTNMADNASTVYVTNQYFTPGSNSFGNGIPFNDVKITPETLIYGVGEKVSLSFTMNSSDTGYSSREVTVKLNGLEDASGRTTFTEIPGNNRTVTINDIVTTSLDGNVSFTVAAEGYITATSPMRLRRQGAFDDLIVGDGSGVVRGANVQTSVSFTMDDIDNNLAGRSILVTFDGLVNAQGQNSMTIVPVTGGDVTVNGKTVTINNLYTTTNQGTISFTVLETNGVYGPAATESAQFGRRGYAFANLTIPDRIRRGVDVAVTISFEMDPADPDYASKTVKVSLTGLKDASGNTEIEIVPTSRTVTLDLLTSSRDGQVSYTVSADGYDMGESKVITERPRGNFGTLSFTQGNQTVTELSSTESQDVTLNFNMSDYEDGMTVNVALDGFTSADGSLTTAATRAAVNYTYDPGQAGPHSIKLKTVKGATTCKVALSVNGIDNEDYQFGEGTLYQRSVQKYTVNRTISGSLSGNVSYKKNDTYSVTVTTGDFSKTITGNKITESRFGTYTYSFSLNQWNIEYTDPSQEVKIRMRYNNSSQNYYSGTCTVQDLIDGNISNLVLEKE